ncbi:MAG: hypothetical protein ACKO7P_15880 [Bacteroidota bacterium]
MKSLKLVFIVLSTFYACVSNGQKVYQYKKVTFQSDTNIYLTKNPLIKINGVVIEKKKNSKLIWEVKDGKPHGKVVLYYRNYKMFEADYQNGKKLNTTSYHPLSNIIESNFKFNEYQVLDYKVNYANGNTRFMGSNNLNGNPKGKHNVYFEDGNLKISVNFWESNKQEEKAFYESIPKDKCSLFHSGIIVRPNWMVDDMLWYYTSFSEKDTSTIISEEKAVQHFENLTLKQNNIQRIDFFNSKGEIIYSENWSTWTNGEFNRIYEDKKVSGKIEKTWIEKDDICEISILVNNILCYDLNANLIPCNE